MTKKIKKQTQIPTFNTFAIDVVLPTFSGLIGTGIMINGLINKNTIFAVAGFILLGIAYIQLTYKER